MSLKTFKEILKLSKVSGKEMAEELRLDYNSYRSMTKKNAKVPKWVLAFLIGYNLGKK